MKYFSLIFFAYLITSCTSSKNVVTNTKATKEETIATEIETVTTETVNEEKEEVTENTTANTPQPAIQEAVEIKEEINVSEAFNHDIWNILLQKNVSDTGNVNYLAFKNNPTELRTYIKSLAVNMPNKDWQKQDILAYWINAYNAMTIDLIIRNYPVKSIKDIKDPWDQRLWKLGEKWYNLNEIEHQILRKMDEPRIHFAIVCASYSCPKLQNEAYIASKLEQQLTHATKAFLTDNNRNEISYETIKVSKIFQWFSKDFKQNGSLIDFLNNYSEINIAPHAKKSYKEYNWDLND